MHMSSAERPPHTASDTTIKEMVAAVELPDANGAEKVPIWRVLRRFWGIYVTSDVDQAEVIEDISEDSYISGHYILMTMMSAGIAILGMLLSSPAVVIGAMLLSPLMGPIMGLGLSLAIGDFQWMRKSARALALGTVFAILFTALLVLLSPLQTVTQEIASRTRPNLFDLAVALFSAIAGAYAMIRGRGGSIVGVAIATALMPPLAAVGFGLATLSWSVFGGALLLFVTNLMTIALTMALMARLYGFSTRLSSKATVFQNVVILLSFVGLAVPLGYSLNQIAWEASSSRIANGYLKDLFGDDARVTSVEFAFDADPIAIDATVLTPRFRPGAEAQATTELTKRFERPVSVSIDQYRVGTGEGEADAAQLAAARAEERALSNEREIEQLAERLSLVAGVPPQDVTIDPQRRRAVVKATPLQGATIAAYRALESRVAKLDPEWNLRIEPPAAALPSAAVEDDALTEAGRRTLGDVIWAAQRVGAPVGVNGPAEPLEKAIAELTERGIVAVRSPERPTSRDRLNFTWLAPDAIAN